MTSEQICPGERRGARKFLKRLSKRAMRRLRRHDPENAPRKIRYRGYSL